MSTEEKVSQAQGVDSIKGFYDNNKKNINLAMIVVIAITAGAWYYIRQYKPALENDAQSAYFHAERYFQMDSLDQALNGDGINAGMLEIADEFGSTKVGNMAAFYAGRIYLKKGDYENALDQFESASFEDELMSAQVITLQGDCHSELGDFVKAADLYMKAANHRSNELTTPYALSKAGAAYEEAGKLSDALEAYERLRDDYSDKRDAAQVEAKIARVKAKIAAE